MAINSRDRADERDNTPSEWTFLSNHAFVLMCLTADRWARLRDVALQVGITERAVQRIVSELEGRGVLVRVREGRRNRYRIFPDIPMRHPVDGQCTVRDMLKLVLSEEQLKDLTSDKPAKSANKSGKAKVTS